MQQSFSFSRKSSSLWEGANRGLKVLLSAELFCLFFTEMCENVRIKISSKKSMVWDLYIFFSFSHFTSLSAPPVGGPEKTVESKASTVMCREAWLADIIK